MQCEALLLCDDAVFLPDGRLAAIIGDTLLIASEPAPLKRTSLVARIRFDKHEEGEHAVAALLVDADGRPVAPRSTLLAAVSVEDDRAERTLTAVFNCTATIPRAGDYAFHLSVNGVLLASLPIFVRRRKVANFAALDG
jgi:hypothetical protein